MSSDVRLSESEVLLDASQSLRVNSPSFILKVPNGIHLPDPYDLGNPNMTQPLVSGETDVDLMEEIRRLRTQLWWTQKMLVDVVLPALAGKD